MKINACADAGSSTIDYHVHVSMAVSLSVLNDDR